MADFQFPDGSAIHVAAADGQVTVYQGSGGTQGRGAAAMSPDEADQLAAAISAAAKEARGGSEAVVPLGEEPIEPVITEPAPEA